MPRRFNNKPVDDLQTNGRGMIMTSPKSGDDPFVVVTEKALRQIERRLKTRFRAYFRPGERLRLSVEDEQDFVYAQLSMQLPGGTFRLDLEAAMIVQDQDDHFVKATTSRGRLLGAIEFLADRLEEYFRSQRRIRFHIDWRLYPFEAATVRFRGRQRHPELEEQATDLLEQQDEEPSS